MEVFEKIKIRLDEDTYIELYKGATIRDDLTQTDAKIVKLEKDVNGNLGLWLDNDYLGGGRHPWEVSPARIKQ